jgi:hypothetical protein
VEQFERFIQERTYLKNVSPRTIEWYRESFRWLNNPEPTQADLTDLVIKDATGGIESDILQQSLPSRERLSSLARPERQPEVWGGMPASSSGEVERAPDRYARIPNGRY